jgi:hypothetical protein
MGKMATTLDDKLPAFQKDLLEKNLAPAKNVPFYAHWVSRFLDYARRNEFSALEYQYRFLLFQSVLLDSDLPHSEFLDFSQEGHGKLPDKFYVAGQTGIGKFPTAVLKDFFLGC